MARRAAWVAGGLCGAAVAVALLLYALGLEVVGDDGRDRRGFTPPRHDSGHDLSPPEPTPT